jgi:hypothetical protein
LLLKLRIPHFQECSSTLRAFMEERYDEICER